MSVAYSPQQIRSILAPFLKETGIKVTVSESEGHTFVEYDMKYDNRKHELLEFMRNNIKGFNQIF